MGRAITRLTLDVQFPAAERVHELLDDVVVGVVEAEQLGGGGGGVGRLRGVGGGRRGALVPDATPGIAAAADGVGVVGGPPRVAAAAAGLQGDVPADEAVGVTRRGAQEVLQSLEREVEG